MKLSRLITIFTFLLVIITCVGTDFANVSFANSTYSIPYEWETKGNGEGYLYEGTIKLKLSGAVGEIDSDGTMHFIRIPDAYTFGRRVHIDQASYFPTTYNENPNAPITGYTVNLNREYRTESQIAKLGEVDNTVISMAATEQLRKHSIKLIPVLEGSTLTIGLGTCEYLQCLLNWEHGFEGTPPILTAGSEQKAFFFQMWKGDAPQTFTFKKVSNSQGSVRIYKLDNMYHELGENIAFYVVTEAEAKAWTEKPFEPELNATPISSKIIVDGKALTFDAYNIEGSSHVLLTDLGKALENTDKEFAVNHRRDYTTIEFTKKYKAVGGELTLGDGIKKVATFSEASTFASFPKADTLYLDYQSFDIDGKTYFKLRDIAKLLDFAIGWDDLAKTVTIDTTANYLEPGELPDSEKPYIRLTPKDKNTVVKAGIAKVNQIDGTLTLFCWKGNSITFKDTPAASSLTFSYANKKDIGNVMLYINGKQVDTLVFPNITDGRPYFIEISFDINVPKGADVMIKLGADGDLDLKYIDFYK